MSWRLPLTLLLLVLGCHWQYCASTRNSLLDLLEQQVEAFNASKGHRLHSNWDSTGRGSWTHAVVLKEHKLVLCTMPKCGSTQWRKMMRRLNGAKDYLRRDPHNPQSNGLQLLNTLPLHEVEAIVNDPTYTKAVFARSPITRVLSAYRDKLESRGEFHRAPIRRQMDKTTTSFSKFIDLVTQVTRDVQLDEHWRKESAFCGIRSFDYDFVGYFEDIEHDSRALLDKLGLWEDYAASGWGKAGNESFLYSTSTAKTATLTGSSRVSALAAYYDKSTLQKVYDYYDEDFRRFLFHKFSYEDIVNGNIDNFHG